MGNGTDNCPNVANSGQTDFDGDDWVMPATAIRTEMGLAMARINVL